MKKKTNLIHITCFRSCSNKVISETNLFYLVFIIKESKETVFNKFLNCKQTFFIHKILSISLSFLHRYGN